METTKDLDNYLFTQKSGLEDTVSRQRLAVLFDKGTFVEIAGHLEKKDEPVSLICGYGKISGALVYAFSQQGAVSPTHIKKMNKVYELAIKSDAPLIGIYDSHGLDLSYGLETLNVCGELILSQNKLSGKVLQLSVVLGPCIGTNAILANAGDFIIMSQNGSFFTTPPTLDPDEVVGTPKAVAASGIAHLTYETDEEALTSARNLVSLIYQKEDGEYSEPENGGENLKKLAENPDEINMKNIAVNVFDKGSVIELMPDYGRGVYGALTLLENKPVGVIATLGDSMQADDCVKIARLVSVWDSLGIPVATFVDSEGMTLSEVTATRDISKVAHVYANATVPKVSIVAGKAFGIGYVAFVSPSSNSDYSVAWPQAVLSPLLPSTAVAFLYGSMITSERSREELVNEYKTTTASAQKAARDGMIDDILRPESTRSFLATVLEVLKNKENIKPERKHGNIPF